MMLMSEVTPEKVLEWKRIYEKYKDYLYPNRKSASDLIKYLNNKYVVIENTDNQMKQIVCDEVTSNSVFAEKLQSNKEPKAIVLEVVNVKESSTLYEKQDDIFRGQGIFVGIELETAHLHVEGSSLLYDELFVYRGLDYKDLKNYFLVAEYITGLKKFDMLDKVITY